MIDLERIKWDEQGLIPAVVTDAVTKEVLTLAYMNRRSLEKTIETGETWFYSRSRRSLWHKGETSGNLQKVVSISLDCDGDALLVKVRPAGPACHTGEWSCFHQALWGDEPEEKLPDVLAQLERTVAEREKERPEGSYTTYLFEKGLDKILKKVGEETSEVIIAAKNRSPEELRYEVSDLLYHLFVLLREQGLPFEKVLEELKGRMKPEEKRKG
ncbi:bifunctional phosphoribosyl-AMP cyclohydrolase/phosphoribosyl-ATP diphosphatase HisIE [Thermicanus aegyptius]|uniref:bifunctional phosphoribosyl-AMP cyclohydrolase/phosphoribosyl-ATP diphosphatase HisIE n=1 Tax=Thermicanus aegyptius TaxID=94009 RepID=UPI0004105C33|nr:bifunctional phosphoribosyl-AMP cyclohydrolase/phosphoribosyl-ATP diphosphatase HisIE [Thermicanus aegyptius]